MNVREQEQALMVHMLDKARTQRLVDEAPGPAQTLRKRLRDMKNHGAERIVRILREAAIQTVRAQKAEQLDKIMLVTPLNTILNRFDRFRAVKQRLEQHHLWKNLGGFLDHLERNGKSLVMIGLPATSFKESAHMESRYGMLLFTKLPVCVQREFQPLAAIGPASDVPQDIIAYTYRWSRLPVWKCQALIATPASSTNSSQEPQEGIKIPEECSYELASCLLGAYLSEEKVTKCRRDLLRWKLDILHCLAQADDQKLQLYMDRFSNWRHDDKTIRQLEYIHLNDRTSRHLRLLYGTPAGFVTNGGAKTIDELVSRIRVKPPEWVQELDDSTVHDIFMGLTSYVDALGADVHDRVANAIDEYLRLEAVEKYDKQIRALPTSVKDKIVAKLSVKPTDRPHPEQPQPLGRSQACSKRKRGGDFVCDDKIHFTGDRAPYSNYNIDLNGKTASFQRVSFLQMLRFAVALLREKENGWVEKEILEKEGIISDSKEYQWVYRLRKKLDPLLLKKKGYQFIQHGDNDYRMAAMPHNVTYDEDSLRSITDPGIRKVVRRLLEPEPEPEK